MSQRAFILFISRPHTPKHEDSCSPCSQLSVMLVRYINFVLYLMGRKKTYIITLCAAEFCPVDSQLLMNK